MSIETLEGENTELKAANAALKRELTELKADNIARQHEIAELKAAKSAAQDQIKLMETIFDSLSEGVAATDLEGKSLLANRTAQEIIGMGPTGDPPEEWNETYGTFYPDQVTMVPVTELPLYKAMQGAITNNVELFIRNKGRPDGAFISVSGRPLYDEATDLIGGVVTLSDVSALKAIQDQLEVTIKDLQTRNSLMEVTNDQLELRTQLLHTIFNSISDGVVVAGETSNIIMANSSSKRILGEIPFLKSSDEWFKPGLYFYPDKVTPFPMEEHPLFKAIWGKSTDNVEMFIQADDTQEGIYASVSGRPLRDREMNWRGGVALFHDMTEQVETQEALAQAFAQGRLEIVDTILHNIGNAINSVAVGIDTIDYQLTSDRLIPRLTALAKTIEEHQDDLSDYITKNPQGQKIAPFILTLATDFDTVRQELHQTVQRIKDRTRYIVDIIRTQNAYQGTSVTRKDINLADAISDAIKMLQDSIDKRNIHIEIDCDNAPQEIRIQESQFHQMLVNLIKNAVEAIDALTAVGEHTEAAYIKCRAYIEGDFLRLDITDNGIGIDPENISKVFAAGFTTKAQGNGLGLHSSANFVISSGGKIQALSEGVGKGATIKITFPYASAHR